MPFYPVVIDPSCCCACVWCSRDSTAVTRCASVSARHSAPALCGRAGCVGRVLLTLPPPAKLLPLLAPTARWRLVVSAARSHRRRHQHNPLTARCAVALSVTGACACRNQQAGAISRAHRCETLAGCVCECVQCACMKCKETPHRIRRC